MGNDLTVLISSVSKKIPLVKGVRQALEKTDRPFKLIGGDSDPACIGRFFVDQFWQMPPLASLAPEEFMSKCEELGITRVIPTRDGELLYYASHKTLFESKGIQVMISEKEAIETCIDKLRFYDVLSEKGFSPIPTALTPEEFGSSPLVVKERFGAGSLEIGLNLSLAEALNHAKKLKSPLFQPYIPGHEVSVDLYIDKEGKAKGVIARKRELVVAGESQITTTYRNKTLEKMCVEMAESIGLFGHVMFQLIEDEASEKIHVLECNPRFGGASTLSLAMGLDSFYWFWREADGTPLSVHPFHRSHKEKTLVRYPEDLILS